MLIVLFPLAMAAPPVTSSSTAANASSLSDARRAPVSSEVGEGEDDPPIELPPPPVVRATPESAAHAASSGRLLGAACSYTTGLMARHVLEDGADWSTASALVPASTDGDARVAAPYTIEADASVHLIATELLEELSNDTAAGTTVKLGGRMMEVDGVRYVVLTSYQGSAPAP